MFRKSLRVACVLTAFACEIAAANGTVRVYPAIVSGSRGIDELTLVAATTNIPIYEDATGRRLLATIDFSSFLNSWLETVIARLGYRPLPPALAKDAELGSPGLLLELRGLDIDLTGGLVRYDGALIVFRPRHPPIRQEFSSRLDLGVVEEAKLEPYKLLSHDLAPLLASIRRRIGDDLGKHAAPLDAWLAGK